MLDNATRMTSDVHQAHRLIRPLWRALCFSLIASFFPFAALGDDLLPLLAPESPAAGDSTSHFPPPAPLDPSQGEPAAAGPWEMAPAEPPVTAPLYWIASSRCSVQNIHERCRGPWGLQVFQRACDGRMHESGIGSLASQLQPGLPVCIVVHGSFVKWEDELKEAHSLSRRLQTASPCPLQIIYFTWPSDGPYTYCMPLDVVVRGRQADFNGFHLAYLISQIPESCPVSMIGHSHGARVVLSAMHLAGGGAIENHRFPYSMGSGRRYRVVLAAGAMDHQWLNPGEQFGCALNPIECLLNLQNQKDLALALYPLHRPCAGRAIARAGITRRDAQRIGYNAVKVRNLDVSDQIGHAHFWPQYYNQPAVIAAMLPYLHFW